MNRADKTAGEAPRPKVGGDLPPGAIKVRPRNPQPQAAPMAPAPAATTVPQAMIAAMAAVQPASPPPFQVPQPPYQPSSQPTANVSPPMPMAPQQAPLPPAMPALSPLQQTPLRPIATPVPTQALPPTMPPYQPPAPSDQAVPPVAPPLPAGNGAHAKPDLTGLPPAIAASIAKLAGMGEQQQKQTAPPQPLAGLPKKVSTS